MKANSPNINISNNILIINQYASEDHDPLGSYKKNPDNNSDKLNSKLNIGLEQELPLSLSLNKKRNSSYSKKIRVCFVDKISKKRLVDMVEIESFKEFNVNEELQTPNNPKKSCCCMLF